MDICGLCEFTYAWSLALEDCAAQSVQTPCNSTFVLYFEAGKVRYSTILHETQLGLQFN